MEYCIKECWQGYIYIIWIKEEIEKILYNNPPSGFTEVQRLSERLAQLSQEIDSATERWLELAERVS